MNKLIILPCIFAKCTSISFGWTHCDASSTLVAKQQGDKQYVFYLENNDLKAAVITNDGEGIQMPIAGIPEKYAQNIDQDQVAPITNLLSNCFFSVKSGQICIHARGYGGWGDLQHNGYGNGLFGKVIWYSPAEGTYIWARDVFEGCVQNTQVTDTAVTFVGRQSEKKSVDAKIVAKACLSVDTDDATDSVKLSNLDATAAAQMWHFNTYYCKGGLENDSRLNIVVDQFIKSVGIMYLTASSLEELGKGLHPLQDVFAHTDAFVSMYYFWDDIFGIDRTFLGHLGYKGKGADNPYYIKKEKHSYITAVSYDSSAIDKNRYPDATLSQRYSDTKTASYIYMYCYKLLTQRNFSAEISQVIKNRLEQSVSAYDSDNDSDGYGKESPRGTHAIYYFMSALKNRLHAAKADIACVGNGIQEVVNHFKHEGNKAFDMTEMYVDALTNGEPLAGRLDRVIAELTSFMDIFTEVSKNPLPDESPRSCPASNLTDVGSSMLRKIFCCACNPNESDIASLVANSTTPRIVEGVGTENRQGN